MFGRLFNNKTGDEVVARGHCEPARVFAWGWSS
jgi:hypothetical protein